MPEPNINQNKPLMPVIYLPHGGGPMPLMGEPRHAGIIKFLKEVASTLPRPKAILIVSAHWTAQDATITTSQSPELIYDYWGFPEQCYEYKYPVKGDLALAERVAQLLTNKQVTCALDAQRGFDHGAFVPLMLMYPKADIPVIQLSLLTSLDPKAHIKIGEALCSLREQGVLIIGSGMSFDNRAGSASDSQAFDSWLTQTLVKQTAQKAKQSLELWEQAPAARESHPHEEHLLPLHVCLGAAGKHTEFAEKVFSETFFSFQVSGFLWR